jgi:hypothetical protein
MCAICIFISKRFLGIELRLSDGLRRCNVEDDCDVLEGGGVTWLAVWPFIPVENILFDKYLQLVTYRILCM